MKREVFVTEDGSTSLRIPEWDEQYHSKHGAIQEANHVYISTGLTYFIENKYSDYPINILEVGLGTGLNALLTALYAEQHTIPINYNALEAYPLSEKEWQSLNYPTCLSEAHAQTILEKIHRADWGVRVQISPYFQLKKEQKLFQDFSEKATTDLIYFDAFGPQVQPELWTSFIFKAMYKALKERGVLTTYSAKGSVRRTLQSVGFTVERLPGPPGKREMLRAVKAPL